MAASWQATDPARAKVAHELAVIIHSGDKLSAHNRLNLISGSQVSSIRLGGSHDGFLSATNRCITSGTVDG